MKKIISIVAIVGLLFVLAVQSGLVRGDGQGEIPAAGEGYVIVRATEVFGMQPSSLVTIWEDGTVDEDELGKLSPKKMDENLLIIQSKLNEIDAKGYTLVSTNGGNSDNLITMTFIFKKVL
ncbi:MAG: hypothetical protein KDC05_14180 [Bacteroidales bacterium]|nr:hypothetical protein [Bacteroidales bacterium]